MLAIRRVGRARAGREGDETGGEDGKKQKKHLSLIDQCIALRRRPVANSRTSAKTSAHLSNPVPLSGDRGISIDTERAGLQALIVEGQRGGTTRQKRTERKKRKKKENEKNEATPENAS